MQQTNYNTNIDFRQVYSMSSNYSDKQQAEMAEVDSSQRQERLDTQSIAPSVVLRSASGTDTHTWLDTLSVAPRPKPVSDQFPHFPQQNQGSERNDYSRQGFSGWQVL